MNAPAKVMPAVGRLRLRTISKEFDVDSVESLQRLLRESYKGKHVTVIYKPTNGFLKIKYCSVTATGEIIETYGNGELVDFDSIRKTIMQ